MSENVNHRKLLIGAIVIVSFFLAWTNRYEQVGGFLYRDKWLGGVVNMCEMKPLPTRIYDAVAGLFCTRNDDIYTDPIVDIGDGSPTDNKTRIKPGK